MLRTLGPVTSLVLLVTAGWFALADPSTCTCGADVPHPHPWFELPGHHHDHGTSLSGSDSSTGGPSDGPSVRLPVSLPTLGATVPIALLMVHFVLRSLLAGQRYHALHERPPLGRTVLPPVPPPRALVPRGTVARVVAGV